ncbi:MAG: 2,3,4,5-tetrahydropyridine-2,6-dicarboxylate N-succinyltransferase [Gemmatimonadetes bacterium]|nr:2,3,4,5-tetrahydropyridine-2,6-dicarboxylate N-succinyltransferase [Gemmatimonadota bacterium]
MHELQKAIDSAFERRHQLSPASVDRATSDAVLAAVDLLDRGAARVAEKREGEWTVNQWLKKAVLLWFRIAQDRVSDAGYTRFYDRIPLKYAGHGEEEFRAQGARVVPHALVRRGAYVAPDVVLMPSYVNTGAYVDSGTMVDTWATVGSCAQIGRNVHVSGGAGIGGVLEPVQARPTIIEDECFIGARSEIVEGVIVERGAVISMGVFIGQSTRIYDRATGEITFGRVPAGAVVVPGSLPAAESGWRRLVRGPSHSLYCAVIVKRVDEQTRTRVGVNELLRGIWADER